MLLIAICHVYQPLINTNPKVQSCQSFNRSNENFDQFELNTNFHKLKSSYCRKISNAVMEHFLSSVFVAELCLGLPYSANQSEAVANVKLIALSSQPRNSVKVKKTHTAISLKVLRLFKEETCADRLMISDIWELNRSGLANPSWDNPFMLSLKRSHRAFERTTEIARRRKPSTYQYALWNRHSFCPDSLLNQFQFRRDAPANHSSPPTWNTPKFRVTSGSTRLKINGGVYPSAIPRAVRRNTDFINIESAFLRLFQKKEKTNISAVFPSIIERQQCKSHEKVSSQGAVLLISVTLMFAALFLKSDQSVTLQQQEIKKPPPPTVQRTKSVKQV